MRSPYTYIGSIFLILMASQAFASNTEVSFKEPMTINLGYIITVLVITALLLLATGTILTIIKKKGLIKTVQGPKNKTAISIVSSARISTRTTAILLDIGQQRLLILEHPSSVVVKEIHHPTNPSNSSE